jgi:hypothetical protein
LFCELLEEWLFRVETRHTRARKRTKYGCCVTPNGSVFSRARAYKHHMPHFLAISWLDFIAFTTSANR